MDRRTFLKGVFTASAAASLPRAAFANPGPLQVPRTLMSLMFLGGADLRFLFAPEPGTPYAAAYWTARQPLHGSTYATYEDLWAAEYLPTVGPEGTFGIHADAAWLKARFDGGDVAIVCNAFASTNRRQDHSQLISWAGDRSADRLATDRDGWGGRLVEALNATSNVVAMSQNVPVFARGTDPGERLAQVVHARDSRNVALPGPTSNATAQQSIVARALQSYYGGRGPEIQEEKPEDWAYRRFFQHEANLRAFGDALEDRLDTVAPARPASLSGLMSGLNSHHFALQCANVYDCLLASDLLTMRAGYVDLGGWDTHTNAASRIREKLSDVFGSAGGLATLQAELELADAGGLTSGAADQLVWTTSSDFGRQLAANGSAGTDHGRGTYSITVGSAVTGGVYGAMFPEREILPDPADGGRIPYERPGADILGQTAQERVLAAACDWLEPGTGAGVFPDAGTSALEPGVDLSGLFA